MMALQTKAFRRIIPLNTDNDPELWCPTLDDENEDIPNRILFRTRPNCLLHPKKKEPTEAQ